MQALCKYKGLFCIYSGRLKNPIMTIKNNLAILAFAVMAFTSCTQKNDDNNRKVIDDHFKFMNQHNIAAMKAQYADSAFLSSYIMPGYKRGPLGADEIYHFQFYQSPSEQYRVVDVMSNDSATIVQYDVMGYAALNVIRSGYSFRNCTIFRIKSGKITSEITYTGKPVAEVNH